MCIGDILTPRRSGLLTAIIDVETNDVLPFGKEVKRADGKLGYGWDKVSERGGVEKGLNYVDDAQN